MASSWMNMRKRTKMKTEVKPETASKIEKVMEFKRFHAGHGDPYFVHNYENMFSQTEPGMQGLSLRRAYWESLGSPKTITVTIRPGDHLNEDSPIIADFRGGVSL